MAESEFYFKAIHEIKNSITLIDSYLQLLEKKQPNLCQSDYFQISKTEVMRLRSMVLNLSHIHQEDYLHLQKIDLREFLTSCCQWLQVLKEQQELDFSLTLPQTPLPVSMDSQKLGQAITNLFKNAREAMEDTGTIAITAFSKGRNVYLTIADSGCGIAPDKIATIFDAFTTTKEYGSGLGLNITKQIISSHGGSITVQSHPGQGSRFTITLPLSY